jgi:hypothetical protein
MRTALLAAGLMAVLPVPVLEGAEARGYSMMICIAALANWVFLLNVRDERPWRWLVYAALCAAGVWAHFVTAFVPIGHAVWLAARAPRRSEYGPAIRGGLAMTLAAFLSLALYAPVIPDLLAQRATFAATGGEEPSVFGPEGWHTLLQLGGSWYWWAAWPGLTLAVIGWLKRPQGSFAEGDATRESGPEPQETPGVMAPLAGLPVFLIVVIVSGSWMYARFALFGVPGAVMLMAIGLDAVWTWKRAMGFAAGTVLFVASAGDLVLRPSKQPLRAAATVVRTRHAEGERVLVVGLAHRVMDAYLGDLDPVYSLLHGADFSRKLADVEPTWVVLYYPNNVSADTYALLEENGFAVVARPAGWVDWNNGDVLVYWKLPDDW